MQIPVRWTAEGGGTVSPAQSTTSSAGIARASWRLGPTAGPQRLTASAGGASHSFELRAVPNTPFHAAALGGDSQRSSPLGTLDEPLTLLVTDEAGSPVAGVAVVWIADDGGVLEPDGEATDSEGRASARWKLGPAPGPRSASATVPGLAPIRFEAVAAQASLAVISGTDQLGVAGLPLAEPLSVIVTDMAGQPLAGVPVTWAVDPASGSIEPIDARTDDEGRARARWTLPAAAGASRAEATVAEERVWFAATGEGQFPLETLGSLLPGHHLGPTDPTRFARSTGTLRGRLVFVDFPNFPRTDSPGDIADALVLPIESWYRERSGGRLQITIDADEEWTRLELNPTEYMSPGGLMDDRSYLPAVVAATDSRTDFSRYDFVMVVADTRSEPIGARALSYVPGAGISADGIELRQFTISQGMNPVVLIHEIGHLLGLPDLYQSGAPPAEFTGAAGSWDIMSDVRLGEEFMGWPLWKLGWIERADVVAFERGGVEVVLSRIEDRAGRRLVVVPIDANTGWAIEARKAPLGLHLNACEEGVIVYRLTTLPQPAPIRVQRPTIPDDPEVAFDCGPFAFAPLQPRSGRNRFRDPVTGLVVESLEKVGSGWRVRIVQP